MLKRPDKISIFNYCFALGVSEVFFLSSFYLSILDVSLFALALPFSALFLLVSLYLFLRTNKAAKTSHNQEERRSEIYAFYHQSFGIFTIIFFVLLFVALAYIPFFAKRRTCLYTLLFTHGAILFDSFDYLVQGNEIIQTGI